METWSTNRATRRHRTSHHVRLHNWKHGIHHFSPPGRKSTHRTHGRTDRPINSPREETPTIQRRLSGPAWLYSRSGSHLVLFRKLSAIIRHRILCPGDRPYAGYSGTSQGHRRNDPYLGVDSSSRWERGFPNVLQEIRSYGTAAHS